jgi:hypothetical protein
MRRLLIYGSVLFCGAVVLPLAFSLRSLPPIPGPDYQSDPRLSLLKKFFHKRNCPATSYASVFLEAADDYRLDWRLLPSISFLESTCGKAARNNNLFGWGNGEASFHSPQAGIHRVGYRLANSGLYKDKSLDELLYTYNPNLEYAQKVKAVMRRISPRE